MRHGRVPLQKIHWSFAAGSDHISGLPSSPLYPRQRLLLSVLWISNVNGAENQNGISATSCCRRSIGALLLALAIFPACPAHHFIQGSACCSGYLLPSIQTESLQLAVAEDPLGPGALLLALAIFQACPALHSIHGCCCCSGYLMQTVPSIKLESLQVVVAEVPLEPCCWLWPYFLFAQLSTPYMAVAALWILAAVACRLIAEFPNGISARCRCRRSIGALLLALSVFSACPALHSIHGCCCCSGY